MKNQIKKLLPHLAYFYKHLRYRLAITLMVSILVGLLDGLGLAMFIPMLELVSNQGEAATAQQMGNLTFILDALETLGFTLNLTVVLLTMLVFFTLKGIAKWTEAYLNTVYQQYFIRKIRIENIIFLSKYDYQAFVMSDAGKIQNTMSGEVGRVSKAYVNYNLLLQQLVLVMTYTILAFLSNPQFAVLVAVGGILTNFLFLSLYKKTKKLSANLVSKGHEFQGLLIQTVAFFKYLNATGTIKTIKHRLIKKVTEIENVNRQMGLLRAIMVGLREPLMIVIVVATILFQVNVLGGMLSTIILSLLFFYRGLGAVTQMQNSFNQFLSFSGSLVNMEHFTQDLQSHQKRKGKQKLKIHDTTLELKNVSFSFENTVVLSGINLKIQRNEALAIVGESGSGKSTLMNILSGLLRPKEGNFLIGSEDSDNIKMDLLQRRIGYITQEPVIFDDTVFNNVTLWEEKNKANMVRFNQALGQSSILDFVNSLEQQEDARLGNNGINLSGGQKQRISIARELYKDVDFLYMDEATSALDSETEQAIQSSIEALKGQYTILIIAHRLSTIKNADRIVVMNKGRVEQIGTYEELLSQSSNFQKMVQLQEV